MSCAKHASLLKSYEDFLGSFMDMDFELDNIEDFVETNVTGFGTTIDEKIDGIDEYLKLVHIQRNQSEGAQIVWKRIPVSQVINPSKNAATITEEVSVTLKLEEGDHTIPMRLTVSLHCIENKWKVVHWHGSQAVESENDTWHKEEWKQKNEALQKLVDKKTADLESKNRELEIEGALERIRSAAFAMTYSEQLYNVIEVVFTQLKNLGFTLDACFINIFKPDNRDLNIWVGTGKKDYPEKITIPYLNHPLFSRLEKARRLDEKFYQLQVGKKSKDRFIEKRLGHVTIEKERLSGMRDGDGMSISMAVEKHFSLAIYKYTLKNFNSHENSIVKRTAQEFSAAYTRFLDLQKAEKQAHEAQVEAALERIRAQAMAMRESADLLDIVVNMRKEFIALGHEAHYFWHMRWLPDSYDKAMTSGDGTRIGMVMQLPKHIHGDIPLLANWEKSKRPSVVYPMDPDEAVSYINKMVELGDFMQIDPQAPTEQDLRGIGGLTFVMARTSYGEIGYSLPGVVVHPPEEDISVLERLASVFGLAYQRYEDLKKAEERNRETQIELSLERVRSRSMAMHESNELREVIAVVFEELQNLGFVAPACSLIFYQEDQSAQHWFAGFTEGAYPQSYTIPYIDIPYYTDLLDAWKDGAEFEEFIMEGKAKVDYAKWLLSKTDFKDLPKEFVEGSGMKTPEPLYFGDAYNKYGMLETIGNHLLTENKINILKRMSKVFEQTYTRFLDLKKAEAQARAAQIEVALERIRSKSLAMHKTEDLSDVVSELFEQMQGLSVDMGFATVSIFVFEEGNRTFDQWIALPKGVMSLRVPYFNHPISKDLFEAKESGVEYFQKKYTVKQKNSWVEKGFERTDYKKLPRSFKTSLLEAPGYALSIALSKNSGICIPSFEGKFPSEEDVRIMIRVGKVFEQAYIRFLDLKKAEAQAREAQIEAALERVRAKAMGMHNSSDLSETIDLIFHELKGLNIKTLRTGLGLVDGESKTAEIVTSRVEASHDVIKVTGLLDMTAHTILKNVFDHWKEQKEYYPVLKGKQLTTYYQAIGQKVNIPSPSKTHYGCFFYFDEGALYAFSEVPHSDDQLQVLRKFTNVVAITYRRFHDLQKAEERETEAIRQASLDRVRAEIASMRTAHDLERITPLIWKELTELGVPFFRCGVFIIREDEEMVHAYLSTPEGDALGALHIGFNETDLGLISPSIDNWKKQKTYAEVWDRNRFVENMKLFVKRGLIENKTQYQAGEEPPEKLVLHLVPFKQGMLYAGNSSPLTSEQLATMQELANSFSVAYARYEDFVELENAKSKVENTLDELQSTQDQLIQSEKMASLGELTAGIAHEIQNPLNFVNNFSEINKELIQELKEAVVENDQEEIDAIMNDLLENEDKVMLHGKRAEGIVKSMLQHSRGTTNELELTDLNALCDEYLRLAYHGLRAKDKSFQADFSCQLDKKVPKIEVIPQEIGRVILNLINNAFYAVSERRQKGEQDYKPKVNVTTQKLEGSIQIKVKDNGPGIPKQVVDKIFQPFFTTKPTGEGTGLGLSLSYDIITKLHGGSLEVMTKEKMGTEFTIELPMKSKSNPNE